MAAGRLRRGHDAAGPAAPSRSHLSLHATSWYCRRGSLEGARPNAPIRRAIDNHSGLAFSSRRNPL
jgi:hypothetical protein